MALTRPCPSCRKPLAIPQPLPNQIRCDQCGASIKLTGAPTESSIRIGPPSASAGVPLSNVAAGTAAVATASLPKSAPRPSTATLAAGTVIVLFLGCFVFSGVALAMWLVAGARKPIEVVEAKQTPEEQPPEPPPPPPSPPAPAPMPPHIQDAIDKGTAYLQNSLKKNKLPPKGNVKVADRVVGLRALSGLALLECKVPADDPAIQAVLEDVREAGPHLTDAYALSCALFLLNRLHDMDALQGTDRDLVRSMALRLAAGQYASGRWRYVNPVLTPQQEEQLLIRLNDNNYAPARNGGGDNSVTQFVLLALWGSMRRDLPLKAPILCSARQFRQSQSDKGTWSYSGVINGPHQDSGTCAGLVALAMEKTLREDKKYKGHGGSDGASLDPKIDEQIAKAFAHLATIIDRDKQKDGKRLVQADAHGDWYFLWSLERVAVIYDRQEIGGKDWYAWGSELLVKGQRPNGSWQDQNGEVADTCFALLFLMRANLAKDLTESIRTRGGKAFVVP
jgi:hypothetical protein